MFLSNYVSKKEKSMTRKEKKTQISFFTRIFFPEIQTFY